MIVAGPRYRRLRQEFPPADAEPSTSSAVRDRNRTRISLIHRSRGSERRFDCWPPAGSAGVRWARVRGREHTSCNTGLCVLGHASEPTPTARCARCQQTQPGIARLWFRPWHPCYPWLKIRERHSGNSRRQDLTVIHNRHGSARLNEVPVHVPTAIKMLCRRLEDRFFGAPARSVDVRLSTATVQKPERPTPKLLAFCSPVLNDKIQTSLV